jgi:ABC-type transport system involved in Fe-S cluster assembly fused permease/ATPase subunit
VIHCLWMNHPSAIFAAHRQVLVVSGGVIAEQGTHEELLNAGMPRLS